MYSEQVIVLGCEDVMESLNKIPRWGWRLSIYKYKAYNNMSDFYIVLSFSFQRRCSTEPGAYTRREIGLLDYMGGFFEAATSTNSAGQKAAAATRQGCVELPHACRHPAAAGFGTWVVVQQCDNQKEMLVEEQV